MNDRLCTGRIVFILSLFLAWFFFHDVFVNEPEMVVNHMGSFLAACTRTITLLGGGVGEINRLLDVPCAKNDFGWSQGGRS